MNIDDWRAIAYPFGLLASLAFFVRFLVQWLLSESKGRSVVPPSFWRLSLTGNILLMLHAFIQGQFPVCIVQAWGTILALRNLNLMQQEETRWSLRTVYIALGAITAAVVSAFFISGEWISIPHIPLNMGPEPVSAWWHAFGTVGVALFASRFWVQWWQAERQQESTLSTTFWWLSVAGALISIIYFVRLHDIVNAIGPAIGLIPYTRNLLLIRREKKYPKHGPGSCFLFAGEQSGDLIGSHLMHAIKTQIPHVTFSGVGGPKMRSAGISCVLPMEDFQIMGFTAVVRSLPSLFRQFKQVQRYIRHTSPHICVLIDYPGFNIRLAKSLRAKGYKGKIVHYVSPTVWAHGHDRIHTLAKTLDLLLVVYPFEPPYYADTNLSTRFVGHPLVDIIAQHSYDSTWAKNLNSNNLIALFPGSRRDEIKRNFPVQLQAASLLRQEDSSVHFAVSVARRDLMPLLKKIVHASPLLESEITFVSADHTYELMQHCRTAIAKCGTVTLELALHAKPTVVIYGVSRLNRIFAQYVLKLKLDHFCIVNILGKRRIFPELIESGFSFENLYNQVRTIHADTPARNRCIADCKEIAKMLKPSELSASALAAQAIQELL